MIRVKLMGGLGNQMFQYAFGLSLSRKLNTTLELDTFYLDQRKNLRKDSVIRSLDLDVFKLNADVKFYSGNRNYLIRNINKIFPTRFRSYYVERHFQYDPSVLSIRRKNIIVEGYWQSYKYFNDFEAILKDNFIFKFPIMSESNLLYQEIRQTNSVCLNIRRGDFLTDKTLGYKDVEFFKMAIAKLEHLTGIKHKYFIFSDDIEWCSNNFNFIENKIIVDHSHKGPKFSNYLQLMMSCKHFIIPNSSFGWWAAYLSKNSEKIVVAPKIWFLDPKIDTSDLIPKEWYRV